VGGIDPALPGQKGSSWNDLMAWPKKHRKSKVLPSSWAHLGGEALTVLPD